MRNWGLQEWAHFGTILAPIIGLVSVVALAYPDLLRKKDRMRRGEGDHLGLISIHGGDSFKLGRQSQQRRLDGVFTVIGIVVGTSAVLIDYAGLPLAGPGHIWTILSGISLYYFTIRTVSRLQHERSRNMPNIKLFIRYSSIIWVTSSSIILFALAIAIIIYGWKFWVNGDSGATSPWDYIEHFWLAAPATIFTRLISIVSLRLLYVRARRERRASALYIELYRQASSFKKSKRIRTP